jgi:hypothetical protein
MELVCKVCLEMTFMKQVEVAEGRGPRAEEGSIFGSSPDIAKSKHVKRVICVSQFLECKTSACYRVGRFTAETSFGVIFYAQGAALEKQESFSEDYRHHWRKNLRTNDRFVLVKPFCHNFPAITISTPNKPKHCKHV